MSASNGDGVVKIGRMGRKKFQLGDYTPVELDVAETYQDWCEVDQTFRDEKQKVPQDRVPAMNAAAWEFAAEKLGVGEAVRQNKLPVRSLITLAEALAFLKVLKREYDALTDFFGVDSSDEPSSAKHTELIYEE
jgi:hypothetical protein